MNFKDLRAAATTIRGKINAGGAITAEELNTMRQYAQANPNTNTIAEYAVAKRAVKAADAGNGSEE
jgi:hypothetical protein